MGGVNLRHCASFERQTWRIEIWGHCWDLPPRFGVLKPILELSRSRLIIDQRPDWIRIRSAEFGHQLEKIISTSWTTLPRFCSLICGWAGLTKSSIVNRLLRRGSQSRNASSMSLDCPAGSCFSLDLGMLLWRYPFFLRLCLFSSFRMQRLIATCRKNRFRFGLGRL